MRNVKLLYKMMATLSLSLILGCEYQTFENGSVFSVLKFLSSSSMTKPSVTSVVFLNGNGVSKNYYDGCVPAFTGDFMDTVTWNIRHIEPRDCGIVTVSTPVFTWVQKGDRDLSTPWVLRIEDLSRHMIYTKSVQEPRLILADTSLAPGDYRWMVTYKNNSGALVSSAYRRFRVYPESAGVTLPNGSMIASQANSKTHPRALPPGASFSTIVSLALGGEYVTSYKAFMRSADTYSLQVPPVPPADLTRSDFVSDLDYYNWLNYLAGAARVEKIAIQTLGYGKYFSSDLSKSISYEVAGINRLMSLASWPTKGATSETTQDQANREIYLALAQGLDLFYDKLSPSQISTIIIALKDRLQQALVRFPSLDTAPYNSHLVNNTSFATTALMYSVGTPGFSEAYDWLQTACDTWLTVQGTWGADGQWGNSTAYGWYSMVQFVDTLSAFRLIAGVDLSLWPTVGQFGFNQLAFTAPAIKLQNPFGDGIETDSLYSSYTPDIFRLYVALIRNAEHEWYWRAQPSNVYADMRLNPLHYMLLGLNLPKVTPKVPGTNSYIFEDIGQVAIHSMTSDSYRSSLFFRSSRLGSYNHSHADQNSFVFVSKGLPLLISGGYYPYYNSPHHALVGRATRFKNALTFDNGIGQGEPSASPTAPGSPLFSADARGQIINFYDNNVWGVTTGDAALAYRGRDSVTGAWNPLLNNAIRTVAYNRSEKVAVIYDWATSDKNRSWELNFQMVNAPKLIDRTLQVVNGGASACIDIYNLPGSYTLTSGFPIPPENGLPDQFQARYVADVKSSELATVTVVREDCRAVPVEVNFKGTQGAVTINKGSPIVFDKKTVQVP